MLSHIIHCSYSLIRRIENSPLVLYEWKLAKVASVNFIIKQLMKMYKKYEYVYQIYKINKN